MREMDQKTMNAPASISKLATPEIIDALSTYDLETVKRYQRRVRLPKDQHLPGDNGLPVAGHLFPLYFNLHGWLNKQYEEHGSVFRFRLPRKQNGVFLIGPEANQFVFQNEGKLFSNYLAWDSTFERLFDNALLQRDFKDHKVQRKILQQAFKRNAIEDHISLMNPLLEQAILKLPNRRKIKSMDFIKALLLNTGAEVFLGLKTGTQADALNQAFTDIVAATADPLRRQEIWFSPFAKGVRGNKLISDFILGDIPKRRQHEGPDIFSKLCYVRDDNGVLISDQTIKDHLLFLLFAAHDTTTSALSAILYTLATNLDWQQTLREEMFAITDSVPTFENLDGLTKTGWTISEALRMYPALPSMPRWALEGFEFNGHLIPANTRVWLSALMTHHLPEYWEDPYTFDPYRFSPERAEHKKHFFQYIPFGGGAHKCLGLHFAQVQAKIFLFYLLRNYKVTKSPRMTKYKYSNVPLTFPTDGLPLTFVRLQPR